MVESSGVDDDNMKGYVVQVFYKLQKGMYMTFDNDADVDV